MMGMIGVEDRDENAAVEKEFQERLPRIRFDLSSREGRTALLLQFMPALTLPQEPLSPIYYMHPTTYP
jgi:hypothetical protein